MVMIRIITAVMIIAKYSLPTIAFATRNSTRYSDFLLQPYSNPILEVKKGYSQVPANNQSSTFGGAKVGSQLDIMVMILIILDEDQSIDDVERGGLLRILLF